MIFLTDNQVLVENVRKVLPIQCEQKKATKCVPTEKEFIESNVLGFGDDIGSVTNKITAQTELQSMFKPGSPEYNELQYRITAGQHVQQNTIDMLQTSRCRFTLRGVSKNVVNPEIWGVASTGSSARKWALTARLTGKL